MILHLIPYDMKTRLLILSCLLFALNGVYSQNLKHQFEIHSTSVEGETYPIEVVLPDEYDSTLQYPVVYFTDWWFSSETGPNFYNRMRSAGVIVPIIIVGIGTEGDMNDWGLERRRDLSPTHLPDWDIPDSLASGSGGITGGAANFLAFIKNELIPQVEAKYACDTANRGLLGYSYGGLFGCYVLVTEPQLFHKYLLGSPTVMYDDFVVIERLKETPPGMYSSVNAVFISVGEEEPGDYLKGFADIRDLLIKKEVPGLQIESYIVAGEGHLLASTPAIVKGLKFFYGSK
jgi:predicted alpha/beta superfamily hydrolase